MARKHFFITKEELVELYCNQQWSMSDIALEFGCSAQTVCNLLRDNGIPTRSSTTHTERTKEKQSIAKRGSNHPQYGKLRPEHSQKMKIAMKGRSFSEDTRQRMSKAKGGKWGGKFIGPDHPKWLPPEQRKSPLYKQIRDCTKMQEWRKFIFERDDYTCQSCLKRGGILNADHIKQFALILKENGIKTLEDAILCEELWQLSNGRTLCDNCHRKTDTFARKVNR
jgi:transposase-like protein